MHFLLRLLATAAAVWVATRLVPGITYQGSWLGLLGVALVFGIVNAIVRPILFFLTCPLVILTLGLFVLALNALMLMLTSAISGSLGINFHVSGFIPALIGGIVIGIVSAILNIFVGEKKEDREEHHRQ
jgi:putative membrane protein